MDTHGTNGPPESSVCTAKHGMGLYSSPEAVG